MELPRKNGGCRHMQLSEKNIADFQAIYKEYFGKDISPKEALEKGLSLINLLNLLKDMPIPSSIIKENQDECR